MLRRWYRVRRVSLVTLVCFSAVLGYYTFEVVRARAETPRIVAQALATHPLELSPDALSAAQLHALLAVADRHVFTHRGWDSGGGTMTTLTQSLVKALYFEQFTPGIRGNARRVRQIKRLLAGACRRPGLLGTAPNCWTEDPT